MAKNVFSSPKIHIFVAANPNFVVYSVIRILSCLSYDTKMVKKTQIVDGAVRSKQKQHKTKKHTHTFAYL